MFMTIWFVCLLTYSRLSQLSCLLSSVQYVYLPFNPMQVSLYMLEALGYFYRHLEFNGGLSTLSDRLVYLGIKDRKTFIQEWYVATQRDKSLHDSMLHLNRINMVNIILHNQAIPFFFTSLIALVCFVLGLGQCIHYPCVSLSG